MGNQVYDPYGTNRYSSGTIGTNKGFTGQYTDTLTGLDYYNARYYDPVVGVFLAADTVQGNPQGMNPYAYVLGNPETKNDPTGRCPWCVIGVVGAVMLAGAIAGAIGGAVETWVQGQEEHTTPTWQEYRDNMEGGAVIGAVAGVVAIVTLPLGGEVAVGYLIGGTAAGSFATTAIGGFVMGMIRRLNGEIPSQEKPAPSCPAGYTCTKDTPTPTSSTIRLAATHHNYVSSGAMSLTSHAYISKMWNLFYSDTSYTYTPAASSMNTRSISNAFVQRLETMNRDNFS